MVLRKKELGQKRKGLLKGRLRKRLKERRIKAEPFAALLPHIITVTALCSGITGIRFALQENWEAAIFAILLAAFLDGVDGRLARLLGTSSHFGAELDSFADVINFGIAPAFVMYFFSLHSLGNPGWAIVLFFSVCMVLRLARFNVMAHDETKMPIWGKHFSVGAPAPAAALLCLSPLIFEKSFSVHFNEVGVAFVMIAVGWLMVSRIPTLSLKKLPFKQHHTIPVMLMVVILLGCLYSEPWPTLSAAILVYVASLPLVYSKYLQFLKSQKAAQASSSS
ncbi:MAG: CDP-diacylglycerol--serine O-phosphatidyltransferase [Pseudomonadota bacterium]|jgi:CDP-diacylglycerol--serine O-phosphatidyltransferase|nr:CDP-diacylglycerol--serine O-phosphatidyltransferase [Alphaproteobacteria bacterium]